MKKVYILIGPPGAGKGTQAEFLSAEKNLKIIQPGAILRREISLKTKTGKLVNNYVKAGNLVPDEIVNNIIFNKLKETRKDILLDGYPRTKKQALHFNKYLSGKNIFATVIEIKVNKAIILERITGRRSCSCGETYHIKYKPSKKKGYCDKCGKKLFIRKDSLPEVVSNRLDVYKRQTRPIIKFYQQEKDYKFIAIDGNKSWQEVKKELLEKVK